jgi:hypothetical protein
MRAVKTVSWRVLVALALMAALAGSGPLRPAGVARAATLTVTNTNDSGPGSLRAAIQAASAGDTITFDPSVTGTITLTSGELPITQSLSILGPGAATLAISGNDASRVFDITGGTVAISGLALAHALLGSLQNGGAIYHGGGGSLTVTDDVFTNNEANSAGAIEEDAGTLTVSDCTFENNQAYMGGVAGAIWNHGGSLTITNSTFVGNKSNTNEAGAIWNSNAGTASLRQVTLTANQANFVGGGIWNQSGSVTLAASIVAGNMAGRGGPDLAGAFSGSGNLIGDGTGSSGLTNGMNGNLIGTTASPINPLLGTLADNGGPTPTIALLPGSPAIGLAADCSTSSDQRGVPRPDVPGTTCDSGAYEFQARPVITWPNPATIVYGTPLGPAQLDASASVAGSFAYTPPAGTVLPAGPGQVLTTMFTPTDTVDYSATTATAAVTVNKAVLTIMPAGGQGMVAGGTVPATLTYTLSGLVAGDGPGVVSGTAVCTTTATSASPPGSYPISCNVEGLSAANYTFVSGSGTFTVAAPPVPTATSTSTLVPAPPAPAPPAPTATSTSTLAPTSTASPSPSPSSTAAATATLPPTATAVPTSSPVPLQGAPAFAAVLSGTVELRLSAPSNAVAAEQPLPLTASVTREPQGGLLTGFVRVLDGTRVVGTVALHNNSTGLLFASPVTGSHALRAVYAGVWTTPLAITVGRVPGALTITNQRHTVVGGRSSAAPCAPDVTPKGPFEAGCEAVFVHWADPQAAGQHVRYTYTLSYDDGSSQTRTTSATTAVFAVGYRPPPGTAHGQYPTRAWISVVAASGDGTEAASACQRFAVLPG